jgi:hypothetical protein
MAKAKMSLFQLLLPSFLPRPRSHFFVYWLVLLHHRNGAVIHLVLPHNYVHIITQPPNARKLRDLSLARWTS